MKKRSLLFLMVGLVVGMILSSLIYLISKTMHSDTEISCHMPKSTSSRYCVYVRTSGGLFSAHNRLVIGTSADRGLSYEIPYDHDHVTVAWDGVSDDLTVTMPGTRLTIVSSEYVDKR